MGRTVKKSPGRSAGTTRSPHLRLVADRNPKHSAGEATKVRCEGRGTKTKKSAAFRRGRGKHRRSGRAAAPAAAPAPHEREDEDEDEDDAMDGDGDVDQDGGDEDNDEGCDDDDNDEDDESGKKEDEREEKRSEKEMVEFYDLLKNTAPEDVKTIDMALREQVMDSEAPPEGLTSVTARTLWDKARTLASVNEQLARAGKKLQHLAASQTAWGKCLLATEIAGELLRERMDQAKANGKGDRPQRKPVPTRPISREDGVSYFAKRLAPLVDDDGARASIREGRSGDAHLVTFFNKPVRHLTPPYCNLPDHHSPCR